MKEIREYLIDFLFPQSPSLVLVESLSPSALAEILPEAMPLKERDAFALFDYKNPLVRMLIWELKYKGNEKVASKFASILIDILKHEIAERSLESIKWRNPLLIPMPMSKARRRDRGWNQTEILAEELQKYNTEYFFEYRTDILIKELHTESQARTHATKRERQSALHYSMKARDGVSLREKAIILIDDVTTSGATFTEAKRALALNGAKHVLCVAIAH